LRRAEGQRKIDQPIWGDSRLGESEGRWCCEGPGIGGDRTGNTRERERESSTAQRVRVFKPRHRSHGCEGITTTCREKETCCKGHSSGTKTFAEERSTKWTSPRPFSPGHFLIEEGNNATTTQRRPHPHIVTFSKCSSQAREGHGKRHKSGRSPVYSNHLTSISNTGGPETGEAATKGPNIPHR